jgi:predicted dienelactone hydrolase
MAGSDGGIGGSADGGAGEGGDAGSAGEAGSGGGDAGVQPVADPALVGPLAVVAVNGSVPAPSVGTTVNASCFVPDSGGPFPLVTIAPGFQLPASQYVGSAAHLASFGFVACVAAYNASLFSPNHLNNAKEVLAVVDWALAPSGPLAGKADPLRVGAAGHSLGGRLSVLAASLDERIGAVFAMDPVDADDPDASSLLPLPIPTGFLGELTDAEGGFQPCAPADRNFETFYENAGSPSFKVEVLGANHMSFLDDPGSCGIVCSFCKPASIDHDQVISLARSYLAAFFLRHLENTTAYDAYLTGTIAEQRYEQAGVAIIDAK